MIRKIISIDEEKCNGCGLCANACHEGAIEIIDGKARLISDEYCDGLGNCLPECPTGAIKIIEREAKSFDEEKVQKRMEEMKRNNRAADIEEEHAGTGHGAGCETHGPGPEPLACGCPGSAARMIQRKTVQRQDRPAFEYESRQSELSQWPVQLNLVNSRAEYFNNADLLVAADCTAYAYADFHKDFIKGRITVIGCPKLDDIDYYKDKLCDILANNNIRSITVVRMQVPCCSGIVMAVKEAMLETQVIVPYNEVIISPDGSIL